MPTLNTQLDWIYYMVIHPCHHGLFQVPFHRIGRQGNNRDIFESLLVTYAACHFIAIHYRQLTTHQHML